MSASGGQIKPRCPIEDYHAGEIHLLEDGKIRTDFVYPPGEGNIIVTADRKLRKRGQEARFYMPDSQFIDNVQWHCLLPIDLTFNPAVPNQYCHYTDSTEMICPRVSGKREGPRIQKKKTREQALAYEGWLASWIIRLTSSPTRRCC